jgi:outer membrane lipoprotein carrier protein
MLIETIAVARWPLLRSRTLDAVGIDHERRQLHDPGRNGVKCISRFVNRGRAARSEPIQRQSFVMRTVARLAFTLVCVALFGSAADSAAPNPVDATLKAIETRYNRAQSLKLDFSESYIAARRPTQTESGVLYLRKPGRMRWEYSSPAGKLFLADGKDIWSYVPDEHHVEKASFRQSEDARAPLAFLLGKLDFHKDFQSFELRSDAAGTWIAARPKSQNLPYALVEFLAGPDGQIHKVRVTQQDQSKLEFSFTNEQLNAPVAPGLFVFHAPAGVEVVTADTGQPDQGGAH